MNLLKIMLDKEEVKYILKNSKQKKVLFTLIII